VNKRDKRREYLGHLHVVGLHAGGLIRTRGGRARRLHGDQIAVLVEVVRRHLPWTWVGAAATVGVDVAVAVAVAVGVALGVSVNRGDGPAQ
jgi:hypothetical protein